MNVPKGNGRLGPRSRTTLSLQVKVSGAPAGQLPLSIIGPKAPLVDFAAAWVVAFGPVKPHGTEALQTTRLIPGAL